MAEQAGRVTIEEDVVFGRGGARELTCDIFRPPAAAGPVPGLLLAHGGAWRMGDKSQLRAYGIRLALEGFVCVSSSYRLTPEAPWPAQIHDVKTAIRYMRSHAGALGIDPQRIAAVGASAGAHLVLLAASTPNVMEFEGDGGHAGVSTELAAVVAIFSPTVFAPKGERVSGAVPAASLLPDPEQAEAAQLASPIHHVTAKHPPTFLIHGTADTVVPPSASMTMYEALVKAGVPAELHMYAEQPHGFVAEREFHKLNSREIALFLQRYLGLRPRVVSLPRMRRQAG